MEFQKPTGYLKNAYFQGRGRYVNQIIRLTLKFCKTSGNSREMRKFIETRLVDVARENPGCVIYVKPRLMKSPVMTAEYLNGNSHYLNFHQMSSLHIEAWMKWFLTRSGYELFRLNRSGATNRPSIQGIWTPFTYREPETNMIEFPSEELGKCILDKPSATEKLLEIANKYGFEPPVAHKEGVVRN